jgi:transcriptional regulator with XRE-family HTH domain
MPHPKSKKPIDPIIRKLRERRIAKGLSQYELARRLGYTDGLVCLWETGRYRPRRQALVDWCTGLGVEPPRDGT